MMRNLIQTNKTISKLLTKKVAFTCTNLKQVKKENFRSDNYSHVPKQRIDEHFEKLKAIDTANKYFLGIELNTAYQLVYKQDYFNKLKNSSSKYRIDDLPFRMKEGSIELGEQNRIVKKYQKLYLNNLNYKKLTQRMGKLSNNYFTDLINFERKSKIQPNFERYAQSLFRSLENSGYQFELVETQQGFENNQKETKVKINNIHIFKGIKVGRNDNYSLDSYKIIDEESELNNFTTYELHKRIGEKYPQRQWFALQNVMVRFDTSILCPFYIDITHSNRTITELGNCVHNFVFEMNLTQPPKFAQFSLSKQQYMKAFRMNYDNLLITNVDNKNPYYSLLWNMQEKQKMINKLI